MPRRYLRIILFGLVALALSVTPSVAGDVRVGVNIGCRTATAADPLARLRGLSSAQQPRLLRPRRGLQSLRLRWALLHSSQRLLVLRAEPRRPVVFHPRPNGCRGLSSRCGPPYYKVPPGHAKRDGTS